MARQYDPALEWERAQRRQAAEQRRREAELRREERARQHVHAAARQNETDDLNATIEHRLREFEELVASVAGSQVALTFKSLRPPLRFRPFDPGGLDRPAAAPHVMLPGKPGFLGLVFGGRARYERAVASARAEYARAKSVFEAADEARLSALAALRERHDQDCANIRQRAEAQSSEIDQFERDFDEQVPAAVMRFYDAALSRDVLPDPFPSVHRVTYVAESRQLVVEREMPAVDVIPAVTKHRYVKARDAIESSTRSSSQIRELYAGLIARFALRSLDILVRASPTDAVETVVLSCFVNTIDPATGHPIRPCLITVRVAVTSFRRIGLLKVDPVACLRGLNAQVSPSPHELRPVRPIVDFDMADPRFIGTSDVLATLDTRPNLAELTPSEFEALITNLFSKMGLETRLTQASRDGGVDCVAWDMRPVVGGKVIVQAKRYKHTVGVSAVRDLYGTVLNEGAAKGILVTTSGYGKSSFEFAKNKPLELLPGGQLLFLLEEHTGVKAKIEFPDEWKDPQITDQPELV